MNSLRLTMTESIENAPFSTRLKTALKNMAGLPINKIHNLDDVIRRYQQDSHGFQEFFLRIPGAGRVSLDEFMAYADKLDGDGDCTGRTVAIAFEEACSLQDAVAEACNSIDAHTHTYRALRRLQGLLDAATIHLEQAEDERRMFHRKGDEE
jgi:hypothetical protein